MVRKYCSFFCCSGSQTLGGRRAIAIKIKLIDFGKRLLAIHSGCCTFAEKTLYVVYFDQLLGAERIWKLVKTLFSAVFNLFLSISTICQSTDYILELYIRIQLKKSFSYFHCEILATAWIWTQGLSRTESICYQLSYPGLDKENQNWLLTIISTTQLLCVSTRVEIHNTCYMIL